MEQNVLEVHELTKRFGEFTAVDAISFSLRPQEILGLLGPNGAGKTTTIQMLLNLMTPTSGNISYFGAPFKGSETEILGKINYSLGYSSLPWRMTVMENLTVFGWIYEVQNPKQRIEELAQHFEATHLLSKKTQDLSAGELTRVFLIKSFINSPQIVLLDEPTASLDPDISEKIRAFILEERARRNISLLITSHNMTDIEEMCDRVVFLHHGRIIEEGTPRELAKKRKQSEVHLMITSGKEALLALSERYGVNCSERKNYTVIVLEETLIARFLADAGRLGIEYSEIEVVHPSLEDFFIEIGQKK